MSTCDRVLALIVGTGLALSLWHCSLNGECLRYSDCGDGLTCAAGKCVIPASAVGDASADAEVLEAAPDGSSVSTPTPTKDGATGAADAPTAIDAGSSNTDAMNEPGDAAAD